MSGTPRSRSSLYDSLAPVLATLLDGIDRIESAVVMPFPENAHNASCVMPHVFRARERDFENQPEIAACDKRVRVPLLPC